MSAGMTVELGRFARGEDLPVDPATIDAALDAMWREIALRLRAGREDTPTVHRACLFNLVAFAPDTRSEVVVRFLTAALTDRLPARVVLIRAGAKTDAEPRAWIAAQSDPEARATARVSGELIVLAAAGSCLRRIPPLVRSVLEPDLPTTLWWAGAPPLAAPYVADLCGLSDRIVVDSGSFDTGAAVGHALSCRDASRVADLAWPRLRPWRQALARAFDDPACRPFLRRIVDVEIGVGGARDDACRSGAVLLAGWLAAALGWRDARCADDGRVVFTTTAGPSAVRVAPRTDAPRRIVDVALRDTAGAVARFERVASPDRVVAHTPEGFPDVHPAPFREPSAEDVLAAAVLAIGADPIEAAAVRATAEIAELL